MTRSSNPTVTRKSSTNAPRLSASKTSEGQYWVALNGELSLHGVTRTQPVSARVTLNGDTLRAAGDFSVRLSDYDIKPVSAAGGTVKLKDEIKLSFDITARKGLKSVVGRWPLVVGESQERRRAYKREKSRPL